MRFTMGCSVLKIKYATLHLQGRSKEFRYVTVSGGRGILKKKKHKKNKKEEAAYVIQ